MNNMGKTFYTLLVCFIVSGSTLYALPYNTIILDGRPTEYSAGELRGSSSLGEDNSFGAGNVLTNLFVTWDAEYLYIALQGWEADNKLVVMLDVDPGGGTGATTTTNWAGQQPGYIGFNDVGWSARNPSEFGLDYMLASEGFFNDVLRITYDGIEAPTTNNVISLFSEGNGSTPRGTPVDMVVQADDTDCELKGFEARIPWSELYTDDGRFGEVQLGEIVPRGATIRIFANLHNNDFESSFSSDAVIPESVNHIYDDGLLQTAEYIDIVIDEEDNGIPTDLSDGVHPPFLRDVLGKEGGEIVYARFNREVTTETATNVANWVVGGLPILSITNPLPDVVYIFLDDALPSGLIDVVATGVADSNGLSRETALCLVPSTDGLDEPLTVRFILETNSGMGRNRAGPAHGASAFFINGDSPMEWGYPPSMTNPVNQEDPSLPSSSMRYTDIIFPPGTPLEVSYKFSALLTGTGTNNYEAIRLDNYLDAARQITLDPAAPGGVMFVTNYLGAAAAPLRSAEEEEAYEDLYWDWDRGDAGVRERKLLTFSLDLSATNYESIDRVLIQGTDPLRGFNVNDIDISDWAGQGAVGWDVGGLTMTNDGTGVFWLHWSMTDDGFDSEFVPGSPYSLVGGVGESGGTRPYRGESEWLAERTPRSFKYQFYVVNEWGGVFNSPGFDQEVYIEPNMGTSFVFASTWEGGVFDEPEDEDLPDPTEPTMAIGVETVGDSLVVTYDYAPGELLHVVDATTDLQAGFHHFGQRVPINNAGLAEVAMGEDSPLFARVRAARPHPYRGVQWTPNVLADTGGVVRVFYYQSQRNLAGDRNVQIAGEFNDWTAEPMNFGGDAIWYYDLEVSATDDNPVEFKVRNLAGSIWAGPQDSPEPVDNYRVYRDTLRATWDPEVAMPSESITITYDAEGGLLESADPVFIHLGYDDWWDEASSREMTLVGDTVWEYTVEVPEEFNTSLNFVFNDGGDIWDNEDSGRHWRIFIGPIGE